MRRLPVHVCLCVSEFLCNQMEVSLHECVCLFHSLSSPTTLNVSSSLPPALSLPNPTCQCCEQKPGRLSKPQQKISWLSGWLVDWLAGWLADWQHVRSRRQICRESLTDVINEVILGVGSPLHIQFLTITTEHTCSSNSKKKWWYPFHQTKRKIDVRGTESWPETFRTLCPLWISDKTLHSTNPKTLSKLSLR